MTITATKEHRGALGEFSISQCAYAPRKWGDPSVCGGAELGRAPF